MRPYSGEFVKPPAPGSVVTANLVELLAAATLLQALLTLLLFGGSSRLSLRRATFLLVVIR